MHSNPLQDVGGSNQFKPTPITHLCKRVRFRQSECRECVDVCPVDAITLTLGPDIADTCINCGLCQIVCPTEAFEDDSDFDAMLREYLHTEEISADGNLYVHCSSAQPHTNTSFAVNCAGSITENGLLAASRNNKQQLRMTTGQCEHCQLNNGMPLFKRAVDTYQRIVRSVAIPPIEIKIRVQPKPTQSDTALSRRAFFNRLSNEVVRHAAQSVVQKEQAMKEWLYGNDGETETKRISPRRAALRQLLCETNQHEALNAVSITLPWKIMRVDEPKCVGCGVCVAVCPTGALEKQTNATQLTRFINHALCTNCGLCGEACPQHIIRFERNYTIWDITEDSKTLVATVPLNACLYCGEIIPVSEGEVCTTCQKRQVVPMFI